MEWIFLSIYERDDSLKKEYPANFIDEKLEIAYVGLLHINPKAIAAFYFIHSECRFSVPWLDDMYKLVLFREGQLYVNEEAKANFTFPRTTDSTFAQIKECKRIATESGYTIEEAYVKLRKLFLLKKGYDNAATATIQEKVAEIRNYKRYEEMTMKEIELSVNKASMMGGLNIVVLNKDVTDFLLKGDNNLTTGISLPFKIMTKTFKGLRKGETMSFAMPSNAGKSRFLMNLVSYLVFVQKQKVLVISNEMTEDKMKLCLATTVINNKEIQAMHKQVLRKAEAELLTRKYRPDPDKGIEVDEDGFVIKGENESNDDYLKRLAEVSSEFQKTVKAMNWLNEQGENAIHFLHTAEHSNDDLRNIILNYYYKEGIEYFFYDTLKTDIEHIGNKDELKKTATVLSNIAQEYGVFVGSTMQLLENTTLPLNMNINDISGSSTVKEVLDNLCLIKEINNTTYQNYEYADKEESTDYKELEKPKLFNTRYYAVVVDKNRAGAKPRLLYRLNLDFNIWEEMGYVRFKQKESEE